MNEKITELMMKATKDMPETYYWPGQYVEKFAELIVKECADTCKDNLVNDEEARAFGLTYNDAVGDCVIQIRQHFGVEE